MLSSIMDSLKGKVSSELQSKANVSEDSIPGIMDVVGDAAKGQLGKQLMSGNVGSLMNLFSSNSNSTEANSIQAGLTSSIVTGLADKLGFDSAKAQSIATIVVPQLINLITKKNDETASDDSSPLEGLFGGGGSSMMDKAKEGLGGFFKK